MRVKISFIRTRAGSDSSEKKEKHFSILDLVFEKIEFKDLPG